MEARDHTQKVAITPKRAPRISADDYTAMYKYSVEQPDEFWAEQAKRLEWFRPWKKVSNVDYSGDVRIRWYEGGELNVAHNCLDRHLQTQGDKPAIIWEGNEPGDSQILTYKQLHAEVCRFANGLKSRGVKAGDRVTIYMPMIPEVAIAMLACARIGAVHSVVFGGFSPEALRGRIVDCESEVIITTDEGVRATKTIPLKANVDEALAPLDGDYQVIVYQRTAGDISWNNGRDIWWHELVADMPESCEAVAMDAEAPLFILYTSGSTGTPKGVLHSSGGYLVYASFTHEVIFDVQPDDVYWCTADVGWVTGHSYMIYGPLANGATTLLFEGVPSYPDGARFWQVVDKHKVTLFYTAPTAIRALMKEQGRGYLKQTSRESLRLLGSVGEPINPEAWKWYYERVGNEQCPIVDTWWQTETGGILITPLAGTVEYKPGSAMQPFFGIQLLILDEKGNELSGEAEGLLCFKQGWPGQMRTLYGDHARFKQTYFSHFDGYYFSGDGAYRDADGHIWITGRVDDVLNVSGHRIGTAEVESALVGHHGVVEAAVVGYPHDIKGQGIYAYVVLDEECQPSEELAVALKAEVVKEIGAISRPDVIQFTPDLPKTRSGKIMRRILRKIAEGSDEFGDISTLLDPDIVRQIQEGAVKK